MSSFKGFAMKGALVVGSIVPGVGGLAAFEHGLELQGKPTTMNGDAEYSANRDWDTAVEAALYMGLGFVGVGTTIATVYLARNSGHEENDEDEYDDRST